MTPRQPARRNRARCQSRTDVEPRNRGRFHASHSLSLVASVHRARARRDRHLHASASGRSTRSTTGTALRRTVTRERLAAGPLSIWRYADLLPVERPPKHASPRDSRPLVPAPLLAEELGIRELWLKLDTANPTHSFKDRVVAVAARKAQELGFGTLSCSSTGNLAGAVAARAAAEGLEAAVFVPSGPRAGEARCRLGVRSATLRGQRNVRPLLAALGRALVRAAWGFVNVNLRSYYAEGSKTIAYEIAEQLGWQAPGRHRGSDRVRRALPQGGLRLCRAGRAAACSTAPARDSSAARQKGCSPVATAFRERTPREAGATRHGRPLARDRQPRGRRLRRRDGS